jgi:biotin carboxylase
LPVVIKADGLAAGKGVVVATTREEAHAASHTRSQASREARAPLSSLVLASHNAVPVHQHRELLRVPKLHLEEGYQTSHPQA